MDRPDNTRLLARRHALAALAGLPAAAAVPAAAAQVALQPTPHQMLGPFFPRNAQERPRQTDPDLLVVERDRVLSLGQPLYLTGRVLDRRGRPLPRAQVQIWQCDANSVYHHPAGGAESERDRHFQGYGRTLADDDGAFHFRTIRPVTYPGRTPHIHVRVEAAGTLPLVTQLYVEGEAGNERDFLFRRLSPAERAQLLLKLAPTASAHPLARATRFRAAIDLVLG